MLGERLGTDIGAYVSKRRETGWKRNGASGREGQEENRNEIGTWGQYARKKVINPPG